MKKFKVIEEVRGSLILSHEIDGSDVIFHLEKDAVDPDDIRLDCDILQNIGADEINGSYLVLRYCNEEHGGFYEIHKALTFETVYSSVDVEDAIELRITDRRVLQKIRDDADCHGNVAGINPLWAMAWSSLEAAADRLDAMFARCEVSEEIARSSGEESHCEAT